MRHFNIILTIVLLGLTISFKAQSKKELALFNTIYKLDSLLFEEGFNNCNLQLVDRLVNEDFEFYHDNNGIQNKKMFLTTFKESLCSTPNKKPIRKLVDGSMQVYPLYNKGEMYGAIQKATQVFRQRHVQVS